jgi:hypothetical protein
MAMAEQPRIPAKQREWCALKKKKKKKSFSSLLVIGDMWKINYRKWHSKNAALFVLKVMGPPPSPSQLPGSSAQRRQPPSPPSPSKLFYYQLNHVFCQGKGHFRSSWR